MSRLLRIPNPKRTGMWEVAEPEELGSVIRPIIKMMRCTRDKQSLAYLRTIGRSHLSYDYTGSVLLAAIGVAPVKSYVSVHLCDDGLVLVDFLIRATDGMSYSRGECISESLERCPPPERIEELCREILQHNPRVREDEWIED